jgi:hypothetical protein
VLRHDHQKIDAGLVDVSHDLDDASERRAIGRGIARELDDHHVLRLRAAEVLVGEEDFIGKPRIEGDHPRSAGVRLEAPDDLRRNPLDDFDDTPLEPPVGALPIDVNQDPVAVESVRELRRRNVDVGEPRLGRNDEAEPSALHLEPPGDEIHLLGEADAVGPRANELSLREQLLDRPLRLEPGLSLHPKLLDEILFGGRPAENSEALLIRRG